MGELTPNVLVLEIGYWTAFMLFEKDIQLFLEWKSNG